MDLPEQSSQRGFRGVHDTAFHVAAGVEPRDAARVATRQVRGDLQRQHRFPLTAQAHDLDLPVLPSMVVGVRDVGGEHRYEP